MEETKKSQPFAQECGKMRFSFQVLLSVHRMYSHLELSLSRIEGEGVAQRQVPNVPAWSDTCPPVFSSPADILESHATKGSQSSSAQVPFPPPALTVTRTPYVENSQTRRGRPEPTQVCMSIHPSWWLTLPSQAKTWAFIFGGSSAISAQDSSQAIHHGPGSGRCRQKSSLVLMWCEEGD